MTKLEQTVDEQLKTIGARCPQLLSALHQNPEAVLGEIKVMESACRAFDEAHRSLQGKSRAATKMMTLVASLRGQFAKQGLVDDKEFASFRQNVVALHTCANKLRDALGGEQHSPETTVR
jgi:hypothetical protein